MRFRQEGRVRIMGGAELRNSNGELPVGGKSRGQA